MHFVFLLILAVGMAMFLHKVFVKKSRITPLVPSKTAHPSHTLSLDKNVLKLRRVHKHNRIEDNLLTALDRHGKEIHATRVQLAQNDSPFEQALARNGVRLAPEPVVETQVELATATQDSTVPLKDEEPQSLEEYQGQEVITNALNLQLSAMRPDQVVLRHLLLTGLPGFGKTLLAKLVARRLQERAQDLGLGEVGFVETYGANLNSVSAIDQVVDQLTKHRAVVWFIDEIHVMTTDMATKIYLLMEEGRYPFAGSLTPTELPPIMVIGATTDYGALHPALKRRFGEPFMMRPLPYETLVQLALALVPSLTLPGAHALADRCKVSGAPHELKTLCEQVSMWARATRAEVVDAVDVVQVLNNLGIDAQGLRPIDRKVLEVMQNMPRRRVRDQEIVAYGGSEADVCNLAGIDRVEFQKVVRPRLMSRGLIHVRAGIGLALTSHPS